MTTAKRPIGLVAVLAVMLSGGMLLPAQAQEGETPKAPHHHQGGGMPPVTAIAHYQALAVKYDRLAAEQQALVQEHTKMMAEFRASANTLAKGTRQDRIDEMNSHCQAIINQAQQLAAEYKSFADWNRTMAKEMK